MGRLDQVAAIYAASDALKWLKALQSLHVDPGVITGPGQITFPMQIIGPEIEQLYVWLCGANDMTDLELMLMVNGWEFTPIGAKHPEAEDDGTSPR